MIELFLNNYYLENSKEDNGELDALMLLTNIIAWFLEEVKKAQHNLHIKKEALDNHPLVRDYLKAYSEVRDLYFELNDILFSNLNLNMKGCK